MSKERKSYDPGILMCDQCCIPRMHTFAGARRVSNMFDRRYALAIETLYSCVCGRVRRWGLEATRALGPDVPFHLPDHQEAVMDPRYMRGG